MKKLTRAQLLADSSRAREANPGPTPSPPAAEPVAGFLAGGIGLPDPFPAEIPPVATSTADLKDGPGSLATAIVAPKVGDIPVESGTPVVVIAKRLLESPTVKKFLHIVAIAWGVLLGYVGFKIYDHGGIFGMDWAPVLRAGIDAGILSLLAGYGITLKAKDNDPVVSKQLFFDTPSKLIPPPQKKGFFSGG